jgi:thiamine monophosphate synthase
LALGGIVAERLDACEQAGAGGAAILGGLLTAEGRDALEQWLRRRRGSVRLPSL